MTVPRVPDWLFVAIVVLAIIVCVIPFTWGTILEERYTRPYTLYAASSQQKWRWAVVVMFWRTLPILGMGLIGPVISPLPNQWPGLPLVCGGLWLVVCPVAALYQRLLFEIQLMQYRWQSDNMRKRPKTYAALSQVFRGFRWMMSDEMKRFLEEGYPDRHGNEPGSAQALAELSQSLSALGYDVTDTTSSLAIKTPLLSRINVTYSAGRYQVEAQYGLAPRRIALLLDAVFYPLGLGAALFILSLEPYDPVFGLLARVIIIVLALGIPYVTYRFVMNERTRQRVQDLVKEIPNAS